MNAGSHKSCHKPPKEPPKPKVVCCRAHEEPAKGCLNDCFLLQYDCTSIGRKDFVCPLYCDPNIDPCVCKKGYLRNGCGKCVPKCQCKANCTMDRVVECGPKQILVGCLDREKDRTCANRYKLRSGANWYEDLQPKNGELCEPQECVCIPPYLRNACGECVLPCECCKRCKTSSKDRCPQPNQERVGYYHHHHHHHRDRCGCNGKSKYAIQRTCSGHTKRYRRNHSNKNKCICKENYVQSSCKSKKCILKEDCGRPCRCTNPCTKKHQMLAVVNGCNKRTCENSRIRYIRACDKVGKWECDCCPPFYLNENTLECVLLKDCPEPTTPSPDTTTVQDSTTPGADTTEIPDSTACSCKTAPPDSNPVGDHTASGTHPV